MKCISLLLLLLQVIWEWANCTTLQTTEFLSTLKQQLYSCCRLMLTSAAASAGWA
jgi:hypothetical protein